MSVKVPDFVHSYPLIVHENAGTAHSLPSLYSITFSVQKFVELILLISSYFAVVKICLGWEKQN